MSTSNVVPLESNPDVSKNWKFLKSACNRLDFSTSLWSLAQVLNKYLAKLGVSEAYQLVDVYGLDDDVLGFIPKPVKALILLFPVSGENEQKNLNDKSIFMHF